MHLFGSLGSIMFMIGFVIAGFLGVKKLVYMQMGVAMPRVSDSAFFYLALTVMVIGSQLFLAGFLGELVSRGSSTRNEYHVDEVI